MVHYSLGATVLSLCFTSYMLLTETAEVNCRPQTFLVLQQQDGNRKKNNNRQFYGGVQTRLQVFKTTVNLNRTLYELNSVSVPPTSTFVFPLLIKPTSIITGVMKRVFLAVCSQFWERKMK